MDQIWNAVCLVVHQIGRYGMQCVRLWTEIGSVFDSARAAHAACVAACLPVCLRDATTPRLRNCARTCLGLTLSGCGYAPCVRYATVAKGTWEKAMKATESSPNAKPYPTGANRAPTCASTHNLPRSAPAAPPSPH
eukprot:1213713-Rhodomonas_salina.1